MGRFWVLRCLARPIRGSRMTALAALTRALWRKPQEGLPIVIYLGSTATRLKASKSQSQIQPLHLGMGYGLVGRYG